MTTTTNAAAAPASADDRLRAARFRRRAGGLATIAAGLLSLAGLAVTPWEREPGQQNQIQAMLDAPGRAQLAAILLFYAFLLYAAAAYAALPLTVHRGRRLAHIGVVLATFGSGMAGILVIDFYDLATARALGVEQTVALQQQQDGVLAAIAAMALPANLGLTVGAALVAFALWRAAVLPVWVPVLLTVGLLTALLFGQTFWPAVSAGLLIAIALTVQGGTILRVSNRRYAGLE